MNALKVGVKYFLNKNRLKLYELISDRSILKDLIKFLHFESGLSYIEIQNFFEISKGVMANLRK